jgi:hypothetical protein
MSIDIAADNGVQLHHARRHWNCLCSPTPIGYRIQMTYTNPSTLYGPRITGTASYDLSGTGALAYARDLQARNSDHQITVTAIPNPYHRPGCVGDIQSGDLYAEHNGNRYCLHCAESIMTFQMRGGISDGR